MHIYHWSDNGLAPGWRQSVIWINDKILLIRITNFSYIWGDIHIFSSKKMYLKTSSVKRRQFCLGFNVLMRNISQLTLFWIAISIHMDSWESGYLGYLMGIYLLPNAPVWKRHHYIIVYYSFFILRTCINNLSNFIYRDIPFVKDTLSKFINNFLCFSVIYIDIARNIPHQLIEAKWRIYASVN